MKKFLPILFFLASIGFADSKSDTTIVPKKAGGSVIISGGTGNGTVYLRNTVRPTMQKFTSGSGTYTTPTGAAWIRVTMVGGGGGGGGGRAQSLVDAGYGSNGSASTWSGGSASAGGGTAATSDPHDPGAGGTASLGSNTGLAINGSPGQSGLNGASSPAKIPGGCGGSSYVGSGGLGGTDFAPPTTLANSGAGGGGGSGGVIGGANGGYTGGGGGGGAFVQFIISSPTSSYTYAVGSGGSSGNAGTSGQAGTAGASGIIIVEEHYN
jgi:hypothetical protein